MQTRKWMAAAAIAAASFAISPVSAEDFKIGYSVFWGTNPFLVTMVNGAKKAAEEWKAKGVNVDLIVTNGGDNDKAKQVSDLEDLYAQGVNGVLIFPGRQRHGRRADQEHLQRREDSGRHHRHRHPLRRVYQPDHHRQSQGWRSRRPTTWPRWFRRAARSSRSTTRRPTTTARPGRKVSRTRAQGARTEVLPEQPVAVLTLDSGRQAMEDLLVSEPDIKGAFAFNQLVLQGAYQALEQAGKAGEVKLVGFDLDPVSYQMVKDGKIDALVVQDPYKMGYDGMNIVLTNLTGRRGGELRRTRHQAPDQGERR